MPEIYSTYFPAPPGTLKISATADHICELSFCRESPPELPYQKLPPVLQQCIVELTEYFKGNRRTFEFSIQQEGTVFQQRVWNELVQIPFGRTISYLELAKRLGDVKAIRAAASTNGKNKIAIIVPCHRVIGSNNTLVGYSGGLSNKKWLLEHEARFARGVQTLF